MASRSTYDAGASALDFFAQFMMNRQAKKEDRIARKEESDLYEKSLEEREIRREEREAKRAETRPVSRSGVYERDNKFGFGKEYVTDKLNQMGDPVGEAFANPREVTEYKGRIDSEKSRQSAADEKMRMDLEDRTLKNTDLVERRKIAERNAGANELRAQNAGKKTPPILGDEPAINTKDALSVIDRYRTSATAAEDGKSWQDAARADGVDPTGLLREANRGSFSAGPSSRGRPNKPVEPILGEKADKPKPKQDAKAPTVGMVQVDEDDGKKYRFKGGNPDDPKNWVAI